MQGCVNCEALWSIAVIFKRAIQKNLTLTEFNSNIKFLSVAQINEKHKCQ